MNVRVWSWEPKTTTVFTGSTARRIEPGNCIELEKEFANEVIELAKASNLDWRLTPPPVDAHGQPHVGVTLSKEQTETLHNVLKDGPVMPIRTLPQAELARLERPTLIKIADLAGCEPIVTDESDADIAKQIFEKVSNAPTPVAASVKASKKKSVKPTKGSKA